MNRSILSITFISLYLAFASSIWAQEVKVSEASKEKSEAGSNEQESGDTKTKLNLQVSPEVQIIILNPFVEFEDIRSDRMIPKGADQDGLFSVRLLAAAKGEVENRKLSVVNPESFPDLLVADDFARLQGMSSRLARGNVTEEAKEIMKRIADGDDRYLILVQYMRVKEGPGGFWNPNTGAIKSSFKSTLLQASLVAPKTGRVIWKNEVFVRKAFRPDSRGFIKNLGLLYQTFTTK